MADDTRSGSASGIPMVEGMSAQGKYLHLEVPDFNDGAGGPPMTSYLHLGAVRDLSIAASPTAPTSTGEDLASMVTSFIDDTRLRDGCPDFVPEPERQAVTAKLHTLGGWRDHSDGNRVTTTRGDKVEIIKGNYRMVVLGRQNDQAGVDISGGHVSQGGITFDGSSVIEYSTEDYGGTWVVVENTRKGHVHTAYHGRVFDYYCGEAVESTTGSETPTALQPNPVVTSWTWAQSIASYTGSSALPVPTVHDETWATHITSKTTATTMTDTTEAATMTSTTTCPVMTSTTTGNSLDTIIGTSTSIQVGAQTQLLVGNMAQVTVGGMENVTLGLILDLIVAGKLDINLALGFKFTADAMFELNPYSQRISEWANQVSEGIQETCAEKLSVSGITTYLSELFEVV